MRRALTAALLVGVLVLVTLALTNGDDGDQYTISAIFDNAGQLVEGNEVRVSGTTVGKIGKLDVTRNKKASVELIVTDRTVIPFKQDAECQIFAQSLIGERYVDCDPGTPDSPELKSSDEDQPPVLPVARTHSPIDIDLVLSQMEAPYPDRFRIILNELGTGVAARQEDINDVIRRSNPSLQKANEFLEIIGDQREQIRSLIADARNAFGAMSANRENVAGFIKNSDRASAISADRREQFAAIFRNLPPVLKELEPTMERLGELSEEFAPAYKAFGDSAPAQAGMLRELGPFTREATPALRRLGEAGDVGEPVLTKATPTLTSLAGFAEEAVKTSDLVSRFATTFRDRGGIEYFLRFFFYATNSLARYDDASHFVGTRLIIDGCAVHNSFETKECSAKYGNEPGVSQAKQASVPRAPRDAKRPKASDDEISVDEQLLNYVVGK